MSSLKCCYWRCARNFHSSFCCRRTKWRWWWWRWSLAPRWFSFFFSFFFFAHCIFAVQVVRKCFPVHLPATWTGYLSLTGCLKADDSTVERSSIFLQQFLLTCMWVGGVRDKWLKPSLGCLGGVSSKTLVIDKVFSSYSSFMSAHGLSRGSERLELLFLAVDRTFEPGHKLYVTEIFFVFLLNKRSQNF